MIRSDENTRRFPCRRIHFLQHSQVLSDRFAAPIRHVGTLSICVSSHIPFFQAFSMAERNFFARSQARFASITEN
jgi:hypothetical protein